MFLAKKVQNGGFPMKKLMLAGAATICLGTVAMAASFDGVYTGSAGGLVALINGDLTYGAQSKGALAHIPPNGSATDTFTLFADLHFETDQARAVQAHS